jgi:hypothetical protein
VSVNESVRSWFVLASLLGLLPPPRKAVNLSVLLIADFTITAGGLNITAISAFVRVSGGSGLRFFLLEGEINVNDADCHFVVVTDFVLADSVVLDIP